MILADEARAILASAARKEPIDRVRAEQFARACIESTDEGRLALAVLDGGLFAGNRLVELAGGVLKGSKVATKASGGRR